MLAPARFLWLSFSAAALGLVLFGAGCTHRGKPVIPPTTPPIQTTFYVSAKTGSDTTGKGTQAAPYKSITKALKAMPSPAPAGATIDIAPGDYDVANGETFPLAIGSDVTLSGQSYGSGPNSGVFIDGIGEDSAYEKLAGATKGTQFATIVTGAAATVTLENVYVGAAHLSLSAQSSYVALDALGATTVSAASFNVGTGASGAKIGGIRVPSATLSCANCVVVGQAFGLAAQMLPRASAAPAVTLSGQAGQSMIVSKGAGVLTDGSATLTAAAQTLQGGTAAYSDALAPLSGVSITAGTVDFGSSSGSAGGNILLGASAAELAIGVPGAIVYAFNDTWNPNVQGSNASGQYQAQQVFKPGSSGKNVTVAAKADKASVTVGPYVAPTSSPTASPTSSSSPTSSPT